MAKAIVVSLLLLLSLCLVHRPGVLAHPHAERAPEGREQPPFRKWATRAGAALTARGFAQCPVSSKSGSRIPALGKPPPPTTRLPPGSGSGFLQLCPSSLASVPPGRHYK